MCKYDTAVVLAGGNSRRIGIQKEKIIVHGEYLIDKIINSLAVEFGEIIVVTNDTAFYSRRNVIVVEDEFKDTGPMAGLHVGLKHSSSDYAYVTGCDMPHINYDFIRHHKKLIDKYSPDVTASSINGYLENLAGFYNRKLCGKVAENIKLNKLKLNTLIRQVKNVVVCEAKVKEFSPDLKVFKNINTQEDLDKYIESM